MELTKNTVATINYHLKDDDGNTIDQSSDGSFSYLHGANNIIPGLETALEGKQAGDEVSVTVPPERAFGQPRADAVRRLSKKYFANPRQLKPGMRTALRTESGSQPVTVVKVGGKVVDVDTNHPYAGLTLTFVIDVVDVRPASAEEIDHGHAHGPGGHAH